MALRKSALTPFTLNCVPQQANNIMFVNTSAWWPKLAINTLDLSRFAMAHPNARLSQFRNRGKANEAGYFVCRCRRRNSSLVVEKR